MAPAGELCVTRNFRDHGLGGTSCFQVAGVIRESLDRGGVADIDVLRILCGVEGDTKGVIESGGELLYLRSLSIGGNAAKGEDDAGAGVGQEEVAIRCGSDQARHGKSPATESHDLLVVRALHGRCVATGV